MSSYAYKDHDREQQSQTLRVAELAKVVKYDPAKLTVDLQPLATARLGAAAEASPSPMRMSVPVLCMGSSNCCVRPWYKPGDIGLIVYCDADITAALSGDTGAADAGSQRSHAAEDGVFVGGVLPSGQSLKGLPKDSLVLAAGSSYVAVSSKGVNIAGALTINGRAYAEHTHTAPANGGQTTGVN